MAGRNRHYNGFGILADILLYYYSKRIDLRYNRQLVNLLNDSGLSLKHSQSDCMDVVEPAVHVFVFSHS